MQVKSIYMNDKFHNDTVSPQQRETSTFNLICQATLWNCSAYIDKKTNEVTGNATEKGIIEFLTKENVNVEHLLAYKNLEGNEVDAVPFSSAIKRQITVMKLEDQPNVVRVLVKGAPDFVMKNCNKILVNEKEMDIDENRKKALLTDECVSILAKMAYRTILVAYKDV